MTETKTQKKAGRPPASEARPSDEIALEALQATLDRGTALLCDHPSTSIVARAARCAKAGVPASTVARALDALQSALDDARDNVNRIYTSPSHKLGAQSRVNLANE